MVNVIRCVIVDDEPIARNILRNYCGHLVDLTIAGEYGNALEARDCLATHAIDLLFLDINMPVLNGIAFLQTLKHPPLVIFTTAYQEYAVQAFELSVCDYLVKPFSLERFIQAVDKGKERLYKVPLHGFLSPGQEPDYFFLRADGKIFKILHDDLLFAEAQGNYTKIVTTERQLMPKMGFSALVSLLPANKFFQVHRSFVLNLSRISHIEGNEVWVKGYKVPVAAQYRKAFLQAIGLPGS